MSGGSFNYLYMWADIHLGLPTEQLDSMQHFLEADNERPEMTLAFKAFREQIDQHHLAIHNLWEQHADFMQAIEWYCSSDWGIESIEEHFKALQERLTHE